MSNLNSRLILLLIEKLIIILGCIEMRALYTYGHVTNPASHKAAMAATRLAVAAHLHPILTLATKTLAFSSC